MLILNLFGFILNTPHLIWLFTAYVTTQYCLKQCLDNNFYSDTLKEIDSSC